MMLSGPSTPQALLGGLPVIIDLWSKQDWRFVSHDVIRIVVNVISGRHYPYYSISMATMTIITAAVMNFHCSIAFIVIVLLSVQQRRLPE